MMVLWISRTNLDIPSEEAAAIEAEVLKPYKEYKQNLQRYEQELANAMRGENPLSDFTRSELKRYQEILNLTDEDIARIEEGITSQKEFVQSPEQVLGATRNAVKQPQKIGNNSTPSPKSKDDNPNPPQPEEPPSKDQPKPNDKRKKALLVTGGGIVTTLAVVGIGGIYWQFQSKFPPCSPTENLCKIFPQVGNGKEDPWVYPNTSSNPKDKPFTSPSPYVSSNDRDCGGSSSPVLKLK